MSAATDPPPARAKRLRLPTLPGFTRLSILLSVIGLGLSGAATLLTFWLMHEPLESVGAAVVNHLASANCTAVTGLLSGLSMARSDSNQGEEDGERTAPHQQTIIGVANLSTGALEDFHSHQLSERQVQEILRTLPLDSGGPPVAAAPMSSAQQRSLNGDLRSHTCPEFGYGLHPEAVRIYPIPNPGPASSGGAARRENPEQWLAFVYGPWTSNGAQKAAFALVNLQDLTIQISGHQHSLDEIWHQNSTNELQIRTAIHPLSILNNHDALIGALPNLHEDDDKLLGLRVIPFANQLLATRLSVNHNTLTRSSQQAAAGIFLMGLLATTTVVLITRRSQIRLQQLNQILAEESRTDSLTRACNRRAWDEALANAESHRQRHGETYALVVIDLDSFKQINDQEGHHRGDATLQLTARLLGEGIRSSDVLARVGGDEFALLLHRPDPSAVEGLIQRLRTSLAAAGIQASFGYSISTADRSIEQTWSLADSDMYLEKNR